MQIADPIRCRVAACREDLNDGNVWSFYLMNDSAATLNSATLEQIDYEWGDDARPGPPARSRLI